MPKMSTLYRHHHTQTFKVKPKPNDFFWAKLLTDKTKQILEATPLEIVQNQQQQDEPIQLTAFQRLRFWFYIKEEKALLF